MLFSSRGMMLHRIRDKSSLGLSQIQNNPTSTEKVNHQDIRCISQFSEARHIPTYATILPELP